MPEAADRGDASSASITSIVFDLGAVLIDWDPRALYLPLLGDPAAVDDFLAEIDFAAWNARQDAGRPFDDAIEELAREHPARHDLIRAYPQRFPDSLLGEVPGSVAVLRDVIDAGLSAYALSNWSAETFPHARERFAFLGWFDGIVLSGAEGVSKPDARLFQILVERYALEPASAVFVDDSRANVAAAAALGFTAIHFTDAASLRAELAGLGVLR